MLYDIIKVQNKIAPSDTIAQSEVFVHHPQTACRWPCTEAAAFLGGHNDLLTDKQVLVLDSINNTSKHQLPGHRI